MGANSDVVTTTVSSLRRRGPCMPLQPWRAFGKFDRSHRMHRVSFPWLEMSSEMAGCGHLNLSALHPQVALETPGVGQGIENVYRLKRPTPRPTDLLKIQMRAFCADNTPKGHSFPTGMVVMWFTGSHIRCMSGAWLSLKLRDSSLLYKRVWRWLPVTHF